MTAPDEQLSTVDVLGPVVSVEVSPCEDDGVSTWVTVPERASVWTVYARYTNGMALATGDHATLTEALLAARAAAADVPVIYRDARRVLDLSVPPDTRTPVPGSFTVELGVCEDHGSCADTEAETVLAVDHFPTRARAEAFGRLVTGRTVVEAECIALWHGYAAGSMMSNRARWEGHPVTDWRVGEHVAGREWLGFGPVDWLIGEHADA